MKTVFEFFVTKIEGDVIATSNKKFLGLFNSEMKKFQNKQKEVSSLAYEKTGDFLTDLFGDDEPLFDITESLKNQGYSYISEKGVQIFKTPNAII